MDAESLSPTELITLIDAPTGEFGTGCSEELASRLNDLSDLVQDYEPEFATVLKKASQYFQKANSQILKRKGKIQSNPVWASLISDPNYKSSELDPLRLCILLEWWNANNEISQQARNEATKNRATVLNQTITDLEKTIYADTGQGVQEFVSALDGMFKGTHQLKDCEDSIDNLKTPDAPGKALRTLVNGLFGGNQRRKRIKRVTAESAEKIEKSPYAESPKSYANVVYLSVEVPRPNSPESETKEDSEDRSLKIGTLEPDAFCTSKTSKKQIAIAEGSASLVGLTILEGSGDGLTPEEGKKAYSILTELGQTARAQSDPDIVAAVSLLQLSMTRSLGINRARSIEVHDGQPLGRFENRVSYDLRTIHFSSPNRAPLWDPTQWTDIGGKAPTNQIALPLERELHKNLAWLNTAPLSAGDRIFKSDPVVTDEKISQICREIRQQLPRFFEFRARLGLPCAIMSERADPTLVQVLTGDTFGLSTAPLHYYGIESNQLIVQYQNALKRYVGAETLPATIDVEYIGSSTALLPDQVYKDFVTELIKEVRLLARGSRHLSRRLEYINSLTRYSAWMLISASSNRGNDSIGEFLYQHLHAAGWCVMWDKQTDGFRHRRIASLCNLVLRQIECLRHVLNDLLSDLESGVLISPLKNELINSLRQSVDGIGPLFVIYPQNEIPRAFKASDLRTAYLDQHGLKTNFMRAHLRMKMDQINLAPSWIYLQLGWAYPRHQAFDRASPISIPMMCEKLSAPLEQILEQDGWTVLPLIASRYSPIVRRQHLTLSTDFQESYTQEKNAIFKSWIDGRRESIRKMGVLMHDRCRAWAKQHIYRIEDKPRAKVDGVTSPVTVTQGDIDHIFESLRSENLSLRETELFLRSIRARVIKLMKNEGWKGLLPPHPHLEQFKPPPVSVPHVNARHVVDTIRDHINSKSISEMDAETLTGHLCLSIMSSYRVLDPEILLEVLQGIRKERFSIGVSGNQYGVAPVSLSPQQGDPFLRSLWLDPDCSRIAAHWISNVSSTPLSAKDLNKAIHSALPAKIRGHSANGLSIRTANAFHMAMRTELPGYIWGVREKADIRSLDPKRCISLVKNMLEPILYTDAASADASLNKSHRHLSKLSCKSDSALGQYKALRSSVYQFIESANDQSLVRGRYKECKKLLSDTFSNQGIDANVRLLACFAHQYVEDEKHRVRVKTAYGYLTDLGLSLLTAAGGRYLGDMEPDELADTFELTIKISDDAPTKIAARLWNFSMMFRDQLPDIDLDLLSEHLGDRNSYKPCNLIIDAEYQAMREALILSQTSGGMTEYESKKARSFFAFGYRIGPRIAEIIQLRHSDVFQIGDLWFIYLRNTVAGRIKTGNSIRLLCLTQLMPRDELDEFLWVLDTSKRRSLTGAQRADAVFQFQNATTVRDFRSMLLSIIRKATGGKATSFQHFRHSVATRLTAELENIQLPGLPDYSKIEAPCPVIHGFKILRILGQYDLSVAAENYSHILHIQGAPSDFKTAANERSSSASIDKENWPVAITPESLITAEFIQPTATIDPLAEAYELARVGIVLNMSAMDETILNDVLTSTTAKRESLTSLIRIHNELIGDIGRSHFGADSIKFLKKHLSINHGEEVLKGSKHPALPTRGGSEIQLTQMIYRLREFNKADLRTLMIWRGGSPESTSQTRQKILERLTNADSDNKGPAATPLTLRFVQLAAICLLCSSSGLD